MLDAATPYNSSLVLRPYQVTDVARLRASYGSGAKAVLYQLATGGGKTIIFSTVAKGAVAKGKRVGVLTHRRELIHQASAKLDWTGVPHGIIAAGLDRDHDEPVQVMSIQTIINRLDALPQFDLLVLDECHHAVAETWAQFLRSQAKAKILGVSATPARNDGKGLGAHCGGFFDHMVCGPATTDLIAQGYLAPTQVFVPAAQIDAAGLRKVAGDWAAGEEMAKRAAVVTGDAVAEFGNKAAGKTALAFCVTVQHAMDVAAAFSAAGYRAACVHGGTPKDERDWLIAGIEDGQRLDVLTACDVISEGVDIPSVGCVILLRPSGSLPLAWQQIGRGMRPKADAAPLVVLDHAGNVDRLGDPGDDVIEWSLDGAKRRPKAPAEKNPDTIGMGQPRVIEQVAGDLVLRDKQAAAKAKWQRMSYGTFKARLRSDADIEAYAKAKGYKFGWQLHFAREQRERFAEPAPAMTVRFPSFGATF